MHLIDVPKGAMGASAVVATTIPHAVGYAYAVKLRGEKRAVVSMFGDGAADEGAFHESLNYAGLAKLPVIFVCENNYYAMGTSLERQSYLQDMSRRGDGVGMTRWQFEAFDAVEVYDNISKAAEHCRSGKGPVIVEGITYRYRGHSMSDPAEAEDGPVSARRKSPMMRGSA